MADYNSDRTGSNIDLTLDKVDALDAKVQPTATGVDVTGTVTADGLTVDGDTILDKARSETKGEGFLTVRQAGSTTNKWNHRFDTGRNYNFDHYNGSTWATRFQLGSNGDMALYEDTGTTQKFVWDASREGLQIGGQANTDSALVASQSSRDSLVRIGSLQAGDYGYNAQIRFQGRDDGGQAYYGDIKFDPDARQLLLTGYHSDGDQLVIDGASGNVGIGTASPTTALDLLGDLTIRRAAVSTQYTQIQSGGGESSIIAKNGVSSLYQAMKFMSGNDSTTTERMRIDSAGNVGIGTDSPSNNIEAYDSVDSTLALTTGNSAMRFVSYNNNNYIQSGTSLAGNNATLVFSGTNGVNERARIDASGNLLVGTTSQISAGKVSIDGGATNNGIVATTDATVGYTAASFDRTASDGTIVQLKKGGVAIGSIGCRSTNNAYFEGISGHGGFTFGDNSILPSQDGNYTDGVTSLGVDAYRFKDLYLSGGVYLGGTGAANKLDEYEEGVFTPSIEFGGGNTGLTYSVRYGRYTKIGNTVTFQAGIDINSKGTSTGSMRMLGLPFTSASGSYHTYPCSVFVAGFTGLGGAPYVTVQEATTQVRFYTHSSTGTQTAITDANASSGYFMVSGTYRV